MKAKRKVDRSAKDEENPEWTQETHARSKPMAEVFSPTALHNFRGPQKAPKKTPKDDVLRDSPKRSTGTMRHKKVPARARG